MSRLDSDLRRSASLPRVLGPIDAFCVVVGCTIGSGIFLVPAKIAQDVPFMSGIILVWVIGGIFSGAGRADTRRTGRDDAPGRRALRLPAGSLWAPARFSVRLG